ncbi:hypothetical protein EB796_025130 [Bugula neritina]|uniref:Uncharacterized protein n=1 Tax=Bugula neritina TaxID=10212 RepID=A0A7J7IRP1_BUGNE|nr:hypothetical protein EB796_025130 [Bugula neritina]
MVLQNLHLSLLSVMPEALSLPNTICNLVSCCSLLSPKTSMSSICITTPSTSFKILFISATKISGALHRP